MTHQQLSSLPASKPLTSNPQSPARPFLLRACLSAFAALLTLGFLPSSSRALATEEPTAEQKQTSTQQADDQSSNREGDPSWIVADEINVLGSEDSYVAEASTSATRTTTELIRVPQSIQVVNRTLIDEQQLTKLSDALVNISGVTPAAPSEPLLINSIVRGFEADIFVDGLSTFGLTAVADPQSLVGFERIEVLKGPTSALFSGGSGSNVGGLINLVTRSPAPTGKYTVGVGGGSDSTLGASFDVNQPLSQSRRALLRLSGEIESADSFIDAIESDRLALHSTLAVGVGDRTSLTFRGQFNDSEMLEYVGLPAAVTIGGEFGVDPLRFSGASDAPPSTIENLVATGRVTHRLSRTAGLTTELRRYESSFEEYSTFPFFAFFPPSPEAPTTYAIIKGQLPTDVEQSTVAPRLEWSPESGGSIEHRLLFGLEIDETDYFAQSGFDFFPIGFLDYADPGSDLTFGNIPSIQSVADQTYETQAAYVQDQISFGSRFHLLAGLRFSSLEITERPEPGRDFDEVTPRLGLTYVMSPRLSAFAGYSEGFRAPLFVNLSGELEPETSQHMEVGLKLSRRAGFSGSVALYQLTRQNVPTADPNAPPENPFAQIQTGEQESRGLEVDLVYEPSPQLSVLLAFAHTDAEVTRDNLLPVGDRLRRVPRNGGRLAVRHRFLETMRGLALGAGVSFFSSREITVPNLDRTEDGALVDLQVSYERGPATFGLSVINVADEELFEPYQYLVQSVVIPTRPRSILGSLKFSF